MQLHLSFDAIGTRWDISSSDEGDQTTIQSIQREVQERIERFDKTYSRFRSDSLVSKMASTAGTYSLPNDGYQLLTFYKQLYDNSNGQVTPLIGQVMSDAGYDASYSFRSKELASPPRWSDCIVFTKTTITLLRPALLDFGAAGKGYLIDIISGILHGFSLTNFVINAGGDIYCYNSGGEHIEIGLENPFQSTEVIGVAAIRNQSICASAGSRRKWGKYHHIMDPTTLTSTQGIEATWVVADSALLADGMATALFFMRPRELAPLYRFEYAILRNDMSLEYSPRFPAVLHTTK